MRTPSNNREKKKRRTDVIHVSVANEEHEDKRTRSAKALHDFTGCSIGTFRNWRAWHCDKSTIPSQPGRGVFCPGFPVVLTEALAEEVGESVNFHDAPLRVGRPLHARAHGVAASLGDLFFHEKIHRTGKPITQKKSLTASGGQTGIPFQQFLHPLPSHRDHPPHRTNTNPHIIEQQPRSNIPHLTIGP